jgi:heme exporter protein D
VNWNSAAEFFAMGGYGLYVWGSYAVAAIIMVAEPLMAARRHAQERVRAAQRRQEETEE